MVSVVQLIVAVVIFVITVTYLKLRAKYRRIAKFCENFSGPPPSPLFGNALDFPTTPDFLRKLTEYTKNYGSVVKIQIGPFHTTLVVSEYKWLEFLLTTNKILNKSINYKYLEPWLGAGLITAKAKKWRRNRKIITPSFHFNILEQFVDVAESAGDVLVKKLKQQSGNKSLDISPYITLCALDVICESAMGTQVQAQENENSPYVHSVKEMCRIFVVRSMSPISGNNFFYTLTKDYWIQRKSLRILHDYTNNVIDIKLEELKNKSGRSEEKNENDLGIKKRKAFLDMLLEATVDGESLTREEIRQQVDTFMFAGHDTTASGITFTLYLLANHPEVQNKVLEEQRTIFGDEPNPQLGYIHFQEMKYLELVIKESMRLYAPVPITGRKADCDVEFDGLVIPKGTDFVLLIDAIHKNPKFFPDPLKFDPERFEKFDGTLPYCYVPFSAGPRNCIGQKFAMMELKSTLSKIVRNFELTPAVPRHTLELSAEAVLKSVNGVKIGLKSRAT